MGTEWSKGYRPERTASWDDIAQTIHDSVTMDEVLSVYCPEIPRRHGRCPCPIHNGTDYNFSYSKLGYKCFVCGASGDVIGFVKDLLRLATRPDAMRRMNADLHLNIPMCGETISAETSAEMDRRRRKAESREAMRTAWWNLYHHYTDEWIECDKAKRTADPNSEEYATAVKRIDYLNYCINGLPEEPR